MKRNTLHNWFLIAFGRQKKFNYNFHAFKKSMPLHWRCIYTVWVAKKEDEGDDEKNSTRKQQTNRRQKRQSKHDTNQLWRFLIAPNAINFFSCPENVMKLLQQLRMMKDNAAQSNSIGKKLCAKKMPSLWIKSNGN